MNNAEWVNKRGYSFNDIIAIKGSSAGNESVTIFVKGKPIEKFKPNGLYTNDSYRLVLAWLDMEHIEPVLDDVERQYLGAIIKPFRKKVVFIRKDMGPGIYAQIIIRVRSAGSVADIEFPFFKGKRMYRGMKVYKEYTIEELGL